MARGFDGSYNNRLERALTVVPDYPISVHCLANIQGGSGTKTAFSIGDKDRNNYYLSLDAVDNGDGTHDLVATRTFFSGGGNNTGVAQPEGAWFGFGAAVDAATVNAYVDGTEHAASIAAGSGVNIDEVVVGNLARSSHSQAWNGHVAECAIWTAFLDADDFSALGRGVSPLLVRPQNLVFYAPLLRDEDNDLFGGGGLSVVIGATIENHPPVYMPRRHDYGLSSGTTERSVSGNAGAVGGVSGTGVSSSRSMGGTADGTGAATGAVGSARPVAASAGAVSGVGGTQLHKAAITGLATAVSGTSGSTGLDRSVSGDTSAVTGVTGSVVPTRTVAGMVNGATAVSAAMTAKHAVAAAVAASGITAAVFSARHGTSGGVSAASGVTVTIGEPEPDYPIVETTIEIVSAT